MEIYTGKRHGTAERIVIYGPEGIGKSTFAASFPDPLFSDTEGSTDNMDIKRFQDPSSWQMLMQQAMYVKANPDICKTYVVDTADWAEKLAVTEVCAKAGVQGIESFGYGKGYTYLEEAFGKWLNLLRELADQGTTVVLTAHAAMRKFEQPDELGAYDRWELKLQKKTGALLKEWASVILFANYETFVVNVDGQGAQKGKNKAQGGKRVMYTSHHPCWDAKNRHGMPDKLDFSFASCEPYLNLTQKKQPAPQPSAAPPAEKKPEAEASVIPDSQTTAVDLESERSSQIAPPEEPKPETETSGGSEAADKQAAIRELEALMTEKNVTWPDLKKAVADKGYYPESTPVENYDINFIRGVLIAAFSELHMYILNQIVPF